MTETTEQLATRVAERFAQKVTQVPSRCGEVTFEVEASSLLEVCRALRDEPEFGFEQLIDLAGVDYLAWAGGEWVTESATSTGFSRGREPVVGEAPAPGLSPEDGAAKRFAVVYHLLSVTHNRRLRLRAWCDAGEPPMVDSVVDVWSSANWFEREAFDLYGILFRGHPDLRRILTDYGFVGHPFRKDFPLIGNVEVRYDPARARVVYEPVAIEPRTLVPRVIREDNRYAEALKDAPRHG
ncbi:MAG TPA: NADH-quinone oxidoreductase subunit C [Steroidobacteraceae bacterium]|nr:NADH-quinone oxidoreductase subunit C [Steroidobacteraceae bacterium]